VIDLVAPLVVIDPELEVSPGIDIGINVPASEVADVPVIVVVEEYSRIDVEVLKVVSLQVWLE